MILLLLFAVLLTIGAWFVWLYLVTPGRDLERIRADQGGTGALDFTIERTGTRFFGGKDFWVADRLMGVPGNGYCRIYQVTVQRAGGVSESYAVAVEAKLFGLQGLTRIDPRAGE